MTAGTMPEPRRRCIMRGLDRGSLAQARLTLALMEKGAPVPQDNTWTEPETYTPNDTRPGWRRVLVGIFRIEG